MEEGTNINIYSYATKLVINSDLSSYYTKTETDNLLNSVNLPSISNYALNADLVLKANSADVYTKLQVDNLISDVEANTNAVLDNKQDVFTVHSDATIYMYSLIDGQFLNR